MTREIRQIYSKLLHIGLPTDAQFKEKLRVELSNQFIFLGLTCVLLHNVVNLFFLHSLVDFCITMVWFSVLAISLLLNMAKRPSLARLSLTFGGVLAVFTLHILFGPGLKLESMYILFLVVAALFFDYSLMIKCVCLIIFSLFLATVICSQTQPIFEELVNPAGGFTRFIFSVIMISSLIGKLILENRRYNIVITDQNEHLKAYNQQLKSFNYIASHDLKEPLRTIVGFSQLMKRDFDNGVDMNEEYLNHLIGSTMQLKKLVDDLKYFTDSKEKEISTEIVTIGDIVDEIRSSFSNIIATKNVEIICKSFPPIISSKIALTIILRNIIENGIKYNNKKQPIIMIDGDITDNMAEISISDNGIGIDKKYFDKVFEMFKRMNSDYKKGSGLGLNITQNLVKRLNGNIFIASSELNVGTTVQVNFPVEMMRSKT